MPFSFQRKTSAPYLHVDVSALFWFWVSLDVFFLLSTIVRLDSSTSRPRLFYVSYIFIVELRFSKYEPRHPRRAQGERREAETLPEIKETHICSMQVVWNSRESLDQKSLSETALSLSNSPKRATCIFRCSVPLPKDNRKKAQSNMFKFMHNDIHYIHIGNGICFYWCPFSKCKYK